MTESQAQPETESRPTIRKAPDTDRHPALAAHPQVDLRTKSATETPAEPAPKKSFWSKFFSRS